MVAQVVRGGHQIVDVGGEVGIREVSVTVAQAGKVKTQGGYPVAGQSTADTRCRGDILGTGKAVGK